MSFTFASALRWWARDLPGNVALSVDGDAVTYAGRTDALEHCVGSDTVG